MRISPDAAARSAAPWRPSRRCRDVAATDAAIRRFCLCPPMSNGRPDAAVTGERCLRRRRGRAGRYRCGRCGSGGVVRRGRPPSPVPPHLSPDGRGRLPPLDGHRLRVLGRTGRCRARRGAPFTVVGVSAAEALSSTAATTLRASTRSAAPSQLRRSGRLCRGRTGAEGTPDDAGPSQPQRGPC